MVHGSIRIEQQRALEDFDQLQCHVQADRNHVVQKNEEAQELQGGNIAIRRRSKCFQAPPVERQACEWKELHKGSSMLQEMVAISNSLRIQKDKRHIGPCIHTNSVLATEMHQQIYISRVYEPWLLPD